MNALLEATQRQLQIISEKAERLEGGVAAEVTNVKQLRVHRDEAVHEAEDLRQRLVIAQEKAESAMAAHDEATIQLKSTAAEYSRAQLLKKKYQNSVDELAGHCRTIVAISGAADQNTFVIADEVTLNVPEKNKQFTVDAVLPVDDPPLTSTSNGNVQSGVPPPNGFTTVGNSGGRSASARGSSAGGVGDTLPSVDEMFLDGIGFSIRGMISDVVAGTSSSLISFGPIASGKTTLFFGEKSTWSASNPNPSVNPSAADHLSQQRARSMSSQRGGVAGGGGSRFGTQQLGNQFSSSSSYQPLRGMVPLFFRELLQSLEGLDVTHYNMRLSFAELHHDSLYDLLGDFNRIPTTTTMNRNNGSYQQQANTGTGSSSAIGGNAVPVNSMADVRLMPFQTTEEVLEILRTGLNRLQSRKKSHLILTAVVENFDSRGNYRKATASFVDLSGFSPALVNGPASANTHPHHHLQAQDSANVPPFAATNGAASRFSSANAQSRGQLHHQHHHESATSSNYLPSNPDQIWVDKTLSIVLHAFQSLATIQQRAGAGGGDVTQYSLSTMDPQQPQGFTAVHPSQRFRGGGDVVDGSHFADPTKLHVGGGGRSLLQVLDSLVGGAANSKSTLLCTVDCRKNSEDEILSTLAQGFVFKSIMNNPVPCDIPAEIQRLQNEMNQF